MTLAINQNQFPDIREAFKKYEDFARVMLDAYVLVDRTGHIVKANGLFSQLVDEKSKQVLKADSFDILLKFYVDDKQLTILDILKNTNPMRIDEVRGMNKHRDDLNLIIGVYPIFEEDTDEHLGAFILIRDVTAEKNLHDIYKTTKTNSITDPLTGIYTRRYFDDYLTLQEKKARVASPEELKDFEKFAIVMVDIDFFKKVNDAYGHQAGDYVLKSVGSIMSTTLRKTDIPCRYGGEEFLVILSGSNLKGALIVAEKLRVTVENMKIIFEQQHIPITISCGVSMLDFIHRGYKESIKLADEALYFSKENGRNQVSFHDDHGVKSSKNHQ
ncbi:MAG: sensor domain-containing diguanylate cyclase [Oligoflexales bacterium]|nr:sensor domain-containing diguanylate cyclase [Oligoflexales bacterium]